MWRPKKPHLILPRKGGLCSMLPQRLMMAAGGSLPPTFYDDIVTAGLTTNLQFCLDAGAGDSYTSGQKWLDLSGNGQDYFLGADGSASSDDPTHNGTVNARTSAEYFTLGGDDWFQTDSEEVWTDDMRNNSVQKSMMGAYYCPASPGASEGLWGTGVGGNEMQTDTSANYHWQKGGVAQKAFATALSTSAWNIIGLSLAGTTANESFGYLNGSFNQSGGSDKWTEPVSTAAGSAMGLCSGRGASRFLGSGWRIAGIAFWSGSYLTKANMDTLYALWNMRMGI